MSWRFAWIVIVVWIAPVSWFTFMGADAMLRRPVPGCRHRYRESIVTWSRVASSANTGSAKNGTASAPFMRLRRVGVGIIEYLHQEKRKNPRVRDTGAKLVCRGRVSPEHRIAAVFSLPRL